MVELQCGRQGWGCVRNRATLQNRTGHDRKRWDVIGHDVTGESRTGHDRT